MFESVLALISDVNKRQLNCVLQNRSLLPTTQISLSCRTKLTLAAMPDKSMML